MISYNYQSTFELKHENHYSKWLNAIAYSESYTIKNLGFVFCSDDFLLDINQKYLNHDTYTDIITFDYVEEDRIIGEIYISIDRVRDNAVAYKVSFLNELHRVMAHGLLHLCGYGDKTQDEQRLMRDLENQKIKMFHVKQ